MGKKGEKKFFPKVCHCGPISGSCASDVTGFETPAKAWHPSKCQDWPRFGRERNSTATPPIQWHKASLGAVTYHEKNGRKVCVAKFGDGKVGESLKMLEFLVLSL
ncbi:hypothetical protein JTE90_029339 [Oedothorax gibbosus]|uniref:Uncharacterized protein n=1 Tax=Oedothorax gibbosus TaxID=931172 RepID=A0AAV6UJ08_9ARAC|nr:hypothetical protein JTE90_029339 [Oedothorax gibbosus]